MLLYESRSPRTSIGPCRPNRFVVPTPRPLTGAAPVGNEVWILAVLPVMGLGAAVARRPGSHRPYGPRRLVLRRWDMISPPLAIRRTPDRLCPARRGLISYHWPPTT